MKRCCMILLAVIMSLSFSLPIWAKAENVTVSAAVSQEITPRAEQTKWYFRIHNGKQQKRLWSVTYQRWLTDWIDC